MKRLLLLAAVMLAAAAPPPGTVVPVRVGGEADFDACGSTMRVTGLNPRGDNFVAVRAAPSTSARELDRLRMGRMVWDCDASRDKQWIGVVYGPAASGMDCRVGTPIARRQPYRGPCRSGWVNSRFLELVAG